MDKHIPSLDAFLGDVAGHEMTIHHADGLLRYIRFSQPGSSICSFNIITWPGSLCIEGDMGTYVFSRLRDMFTFFRSEVPGRINPRYWAEKVEAQCKTDGVYEWDQDQFKGRVVEYVRDWFRDSRNRKDQLRTFQEIRDDVLCYSTEAEARRALNEFHFGDFYFQDTWEWRMKKYTYRFIWNLRAITWAIHKFDEETKA
jgi:hypothetical protein